MEENGAFSLIEDSAVPFFYVSNPSWKQENTYVVPEIVET